MDLLKKKTVIGVSGANSISAGGLSLAQIIKVSRQGEQKDRTSYLFSENFNGSTWAYFFAKKRIVFGISYPFVGDEVIHIIYKVSV